MAAFGSAVIAGAVAAATQVDTANLNVTGTDLCLVVGASQDGAATPVLTLSWDPAGNNEAMTGIFATVEAGAYVDSTLAYLDDPTAANAPVRVSSSASIEDLRVFGAFFTAAGDVVIADTANSALTGVPTSISVTVPNVVSGDMVVDWLTTSGVAPPTLTVGADQTQQVTISTGSFVSAAASTQAGASGGVMSWTMTGVTYGAILIGARIPDAGGGGSSQVAGSSNIDFTPTSSLRGVGRQSGSAAFDFTATASLLGIGSINGVATMNFAPTATIANQAGCSITSVNGDIAWNDGDTGLIIVGTGFLG
jgi:hypothetical protein